MTEKEKKTEIQRVFGSSKVQQLYIPLLISFRIRKLKVIVQAREGLEEIRKRKNNCKDVPYGERPQTR